MNKLTLKLTSLITAALMCALLSSCGVDKKPAVAISSASIDYYVSSYSFFTEDEATVKELAEFYNTLKLRETDTQLELSRAYRVSFGDKSFWLDDNKTVWLNGSTVNYTLVSGKADYDRLKELYEGGRQNSAPVYTAPELTVSDTDENCVTYLGDKSDMLSFTDDLAASGWDRYTDEKSFAFYRDSVILLVNLSGDGTSFTVKTVVGAPLNNGGLTEEDVKFNIGESRSFTVRINVPSLYEKLGAELFFTVLPDLTFRQDLLIDGFTSEIPSFSCLYACADTDDDGEYEFICASPDESSSPATYIISSYTVSGGIKLAHSGRYTPDTLTPRALTGDGSGRLLLLLTDAHGETVKRTVSFLNDKLIVQ